MVQPHRPVGTSLCSADVRWPVHPTTATSLLLSGGVRESVGTTIRGTSRAQESEDLTVRLYVCHRLRPAPRIRTPDRTFDK